MTDPIDLNEYGRDDSGQKVSTDKRLFMQFYAFENATNPDALINLLDAENAQAVVYEDMNHPQGLGVVSFDENPNYFLDVIKPILNTQSDLKLRPHFTMTGRSYSIGYELNVEHVLTRKPVERVCDPDTPWAVWYPVKRTGAFAQLDDEAQREILMEHGHLGHAFGDAGAALDVRLAAHGLNEGDQDFIIGLLGKELFPLSALVQRMRPTVQTSQYVASMGPFFVGRALWQNRGDLA